MISVSKRTSKRLSPTVSAILLDCPQNNQIKCERKIMINVRVKPSLQLDKDEKFLILDELYDTNKKIRTKILSPYVIQLSRGEPIQMFPLEFTKEVKCDNCDNNYKSSSHKELFNKKINQMENNKQGKYNKKINKDLQNDAKIKVQKNKDKKPTTSEFIKNKDFGTRQRITNNKHEPHYLGRKIILKYPIQKQKIHLENKKKKIQSQLQEELEEFIAQQNADNIPLQHNVKSQPLKENSQNQLKQELEKLIQYQNEDINKQEPKLNQRNYKVSVKDGENYNKESSEQKNIQSINNKKSKDIVKFNEANIKDINEKLFDELDKFEEEPKLNSDEDQVKFEGYNENEVNDGEPRSCIKSNCLKTKLFKREILTKPRKNGAADKRKIKTRKVHFHKRKHRKNYFGYKNGKENCAECKQTDELNWDTQDIVNGNLKKLATNQYTVKPGQLLTNGQSAYNDKKEELSTIVHDIDKNKQQYVSNVQKNDENLYNMKYEQNTGITGQRLPNDQSNTNQNEQMLPIAQYIDKNKQNNMENAQNINRNEDNMANDESMEKAAQLLPIPNDQSRVTDQNEQMSDLAQNIDKNKLYNMANVQNIDQNLYEQNTGRTGSSLTNDQNKPISSNVQNVDENQLNYIANVHNIKQNEINMADEQNTGTEEKGLSNYQIKNTDENEQTSATDGNFDNGNGNNMNNVQNIEQDAENIMYGQNTEKSGEYEGKSTSNVDIEKQFFINEENAERQRKLMKQIQLFNEQNFLNEKNTNKEQNSFDVQHDLPIQEIRDDDSDGSDDSSQSIHKWSVKTDKSKNIDNDKVKKFKDVNGAPGNIQITENNEYINKDNNLNDNRLILDHPNTDTLLQNTKTRQTSSGNSIKSLSRKNFKYIDRIPFIESIIRPSRKNNFHSILKYPRNLENIPNRHTECLQEKDSSLIERNNNNIEKLNKDHIDTKKIDRNIHHMFYTTDNGYYGSINFDTITHRADSGVELNLPINSVGNTKLNSGKKKKDIKKKISNNEKKKEIHQLQQISALDNLMLFNQERVKSSPRTQEPNKNYNVKSLNNDNHKDLTKQRIGEHHKSRLQYNKKFNKELDEINRKIYKPCSNCHLTKPIQSKISCSKCGKPTEVYVNLKKDSSTDSCSSCGLKLEKYENNPKHTSRNECSNLNLNENEETEEDFPCNICDSGNNEEINTDESCHSCDSSNQSTDESAETERDCNSCGNRYKQDNKPILRKGFCSRCGSSYLNENRQTQKERSCSPSCNSIPRSDEPLIIGEEEDSEHSDNGFDITESEGTPKSRSQSITVKPSTTEECIICSEDPSENECEENSENSSAIQMNPQNAKSITAELSKTSGNSNAEENECEENESEENSYSSEVESKPQNEKATTGQSSKNSGNSNPSENECEENSYSSEIQIKPQNEKAITGESSKNSGNSNPPTNECIEISINSGNPNQNSTTATVGSSSHKPNKTSGPEGSSNSNKLEMKEKPVSNSSSNSNQKKNEPNSNSSSNSNQKKTGPNSNSSSNSNPKKTGPNSNSSSNSNPKKTGPNSNSSSNSNPKKTGPNKCDNNTSNSNPPKDKPNKSSNNSSTSKPPKDKSNECVKPQNNTKGESRNGSAKSNKPLNETTIREECTNTTGKSANATASAVSSNSSSNSKSPDKCEKKSNSSSIPNKSKNVSSLMGELNMNNYWYRRRSIYNPDYSKLMERSSRETSISGDDNLLPINNGENLSSMDMENAINSKNNEKRNYENLNSKLLDDSSFNEYDYIDSENNENKRESLLYDDDIVNNNFNEYLLQPTLLNNNIQNINGISDMQNEEIPITNDIMNKRTNENSYSPLRNSKDTMATELQRDEDFNLNSQSLIDNALSDNEQNDDENNLGKRNFLTDSESNQQEFSDNLPGKNLDTFEKALQQRDITNEAKLNDENINLNNDIVNSEQINKLEMPSNEREKKNIFVLNNNNDYYDNQDNLNDVSLESNINDDISNDNKRCTICGCNNSPTNDLIDKHCMCDVCPRNINKNNNEEKLENNAEKVCEICGGKNGNGNNGNKCECIRKINDEENSNNFRRESENLNDNFDEENLYYNTLEDLEEDNNDELNLQENTNYRSKRSISNIRYSVYNMSVPMQFITTRIQIYRKRGKSWWKIEPSITLTSLSAIYANDDLSIIFTSHVDVFKPDKPLKILKDHQLLVPKYNNYNETLKVDKNLLVIDKNKYNFNQNNVESIRKLCDLALLYGNDSYRKYRNINQDIINLGDFGYFPAEMNILEKCKNDPTHLCLNIVDEHVPAYSIKIEFPFRQNVLLPSEDILKIRITDIITDATTWGILQVTLIVINEGLVQHDFIIEIKSNGIICPSIQSFVTKTLLPHISETITFLLPLEENKPKIYNSIVVVKTMNNETVAIRDLFIKPSARCFCIWKCNCHCISNLASSIESNICHILPKREVGNAGFSKRSLCKSTTTTLFHQRIKIILLSAIILIIFALIAGFTKAIYGWKCPKVNKWGYNYIQPMHEYEYASKYRRFFINVLFFVVIPFIFLCKCFIPSEEDDLLQTQTAWGCAIQQNIIGSESDTDDNYRKYAGGIQINNCNDVDDDDDDDDDDESTILSQHFEKLPDSKLKTEIDYNTSDSIYDDNDTDINDLNAVIEYKQRIDEMSADHSSEDINEFDSKALEATRIVKRMLASKIVYRTVKAELGNVVVPNDHPYSIRGYFVPSLGTGYQFFTPVPLRQYYLICPESHTLRGIVPPNVLDSRAFTRNYSNRIDVIEAGDISLCPSMNAPCINVLAQDRRMYSSAPTH